MKRPWRTSSYSGDQGNCVKVADQDLDVNPEVGVTDSKNPRGGVLLFAPQSWASFVRTVGMR